MNVFKKTTLAILATPLLVATAAHAADAPEAYAQVTTIQDMRIQQTDKMTFGSDILPIAGTRCTISLNYTKNNEGNPGDGDGHFDHKWNGSGSGCSASNQISGALFDIEGTKNQKVKITLEAPTDQSQVIFRPQAQYFATDTTTLKSTTLADAVVNAVDTSKQDLGDGSIEREVTLHSTSGYGTIAVGGELEVVNLAAGLQNQQITYKVNVTY